MTAVANVDALPVRLRTLQIGAIVEPRSDMITGSQRYYFDLLRALPACGVEALGIVLGTVPPHDANANVEAFAVTGATRRVRLAASRAAVSRALGRTDLVVSHFAPHAYPVLPCIRGTHPLAVHFHGPWTLEGLFHGDRPLARFPLNAAHELTVYHRARRIIALFGAYARVLERVYRVPPERIRVIPGGVDLRRFRIGCSRREARRQLGLSPDRPIVLMVGRLVRGKGVDCTIAAMQFLRRAIPEVLAVVAGIGARAERFAAAVRAAGLERNVRFYGHAGDEALPLLYRAADLSLTTSFGRDGFGLVVPESLACGTPVMLLPVFGGPWPGAHPALTFVRGSRPAELAGELAAALSGARTLPDDATCTAFARDYDWQHIAARVRDVYAEAIA